MRGLRSVSTSWVWLISSTAQGAESGYLGLIGDDTADSSGVRLLEVYPNQPAAQGGLASGDVITEIDGRKVRTVDEMLAARRSVWFG